MKALLIDGHNLIRRIFAAVPGELDSDQHLQGALTSVQASLKRALNTHAPTHCIAVFEHSGSNWRHDLFPDYKKDRPQIPVLLRNNLPRFESVFKESGVTCVSQSGQEADDVLATLASKISEHGGNTVILSTDHNLCQLLSPSISVYDHFAERYLDDDFVLKRYGVRPHQLITLHALTGDSSLSIPGVKSIGIHTAVKLIDDYGELESILAAADKIPGKLSIKLSQGADDARLSFQLFLLKANLTLGINLKECRYKHRLMS